MPTKSSTAYYFSLLTLGPLFAGCQTPADVTLEITTDLPCGQIVSTHVTIGALGEIETKRPAASTPTCQDGKIGSLVVVPQGSEDEPLAVKVVTGVGTLAEDCPAPNYGPGCIVARRALQFSPHTEMTLPVEMRKACEGYVCATDQTCVQGLCVSARIPNPSQCAMLGGCPESVLGGCATDACSAPVWAERFGDAADQVGGGSAADLMGNVIVTGTLHGTMDFGCGPLTAGAPTAMFVAKLDPTGKCMWNRSYDEASPGGIRSVGTDAAGNVVFSGLFSDTVDFGGGYESSVGGQDIFVVALDAAGDYLWDREFGDTADQGLSVLAVSTAGGVVLAGSLVGTFRFGDGPLLDGTKNGMFVTELDAKGVPLWSLPFGDPGQGQVAEVAVDGGGDVLLAGSVQGALDFGGGPLVAGGVGTVFVAKLGGGKLVWGKRFGDSGHSVCAGLAVDHLNDVELVGSVSGTIAFGGGASLGSDGGGSVAFVAKLDPGGNFVWSESFGDSADLQFGDDIVSNRDGSGSLFVTGRYSGQTLTVGDQQLPNPDDEPSIFLAKLRADGVPLWSKRLGDQQNLVRLGFAVGGVPGAFFASGDLAGTVDLGAGAITTAGMSDVFVAKLAQ